MTSCAFTYRQSERASLAETFLPGFILPAQVASDTLLRENRTFLVRILQAKLRFRLPTSSLSEKRGTAICLICIG